MSEAIPISAVIGDQLSEWREAAGLRQDEVARAARELDLPWTQATVAGIETGRREVSLEEFAVLPLIVSKFPRVQGGRFRRASGFLYSDEPGVVVKIGPDSSIRLDHLREIFSGHAVGGDGIVPSSAIYPRAAAWRKIKRRRDAKFGAEMKVARKLGVNQVSVAAASRRLWGQTLTEERDARMAEQAGPDDSARTLQALRGHITRALIDELRPRLPKKNRGSRGEKK